MPNGHEQAHVCKGTHESSISKAHAGTCPTHMAIATGRGRHAHMSHLALPPRSQGEMLSPLSSQPPAGLHSALLVLTQPDTPAARGAFRGSCGKRTTIVGAANWLCVGPWVTARSAMADTFFPLVSGKALLSPLLRPQLATEPHMPGHVGLAGPAGPSDRGPRLTHS